MPAPLTEKEILAVSFDDEGEHGYAKLIRSGGEWDSMVRSAQKAAHLAVAQETARCREILQAARFGQIDGDFRSLIHRVESGDHVTIDPEAT
jgi:hypothetical protein